MKNNPLSSYLSISGMSQADLAKELGVAQSMISDWAGDRRHPSLQNAFALEVVTNGAVPAKSWLARDLKKAG